MTIYTLEEMNIDVANFLNIGSYVEPYMLIYTIQHEFGFRFSEASRPNLWTFNGDNTITIPVLKGQPPRLLTVNNFWYTFLYSLYDYHHVEKWSNESTASRVFIKYYPKKLFLSSGKSLTTHFFRHLYVKRKYSRGWTTRQISADLGEQNDNNTAGYGSSTIVY